MKRIRTERVLLRNYAGRDRDHFIRLFTDREVMRHVGDGALSRERAEKFWSEILRELYPQKKRTVWAVFARKDLRYLGHASIRPRPERPADWEVGFILRKEEWGKGFATEIAGRLIGFGLKNLNLEEVFATVDDENLASIRVLEKAGMIFRRHEFDEQGRFSVYSVGQNGPFGR